MTLTFIFPTSHYEVLYGATLLILPHKVPHCMQRLAELNLLDILEVGYLEVKVTCPHLSPYDIWADTSRTENHTRFKFGIQVPHNKQKSRYDFKIQR